MTNQIESIIKEKTGAESVGEPKLLEELWSGYGNISRYHLKGAAQPSVILKRIKLEESEQHPRGWKTAHSHLRKVESYIIEQEWYRSWSQLCTDDCRVPQCYGIWQEDTERFILLEDLEAAGFDPRVGKIDDAGITSCLRWLADFHVTFLNHKPKGLWKIGTYWNLETRPDEFQVLEDLELKAAAPKIDEVLNNCPLQTIVHGDAKLANFCFTDDHHHVAALDFQYVGGGIGIKDVVYFLGSCVPENEMEAREKELLDLYFGFIDDSLKKQKHTLTRPYVEYFWRPLFHHAWADFHRFLKGWYPLHWKVNDYSQKIAQKVIEEIGK